jgi:hypothetical protein
MKESIESLHRGVVDYVLEWSKDRAGPYWEREIIPDLLGRLRAQDSPPNHVGEPLEWKKEDRPEFLQRWTSCWTRPMGCESYARSAGTPGGLYPDLYLRRSSDGWEWTVEVKIASAKTAKQLETVRFESRSNLFGLNNACECTFTNHLAHDLWRWRKAGHDNYVLLLGLVNTPSSLWFRGKPKCTLELEQVWANLETKWNATLEVLKERVGTKAKPFDVLLATKRIGDGMDGRVEDFRALATGGLAERLGNGISVRRLDT